MLPSAEMLNYEADDLIATILQNKLLKKELKLQLFHLTKI